MLPYYLRYDIRSLRKQSFCLSGVRYIICEFLLAYSHWSTHRWTHRLHYWAVHACSRHLTTNPCGAGDLPGLHLATRDLSWVSKVGLNPPTNARHNILYYRFRREDSRRFTLKSHLPDSCTAIEYELWWALPYSILRAEDEVVRLNISRCHIAPPEHRTCLNVRCWARLLYACCIQWPWYVSTNGILRIQH